MEKFKERFYKILIDRENFFMKQYYSNFHKKEVYLAIKELKDGMYCVLVSREESEEIDTVEAIEYIKSFGKPFSLNNVIISNKEYRDKNNQVLVNKLVIDEENNRVIACDNSCMPLRYIFENFWGSGKENNNRGKSYFNNKSITLIIIGINVIIFLLTAILSGNVFDIDNRVLLKYGAKVNILINRGEVWRVLTCAFLHAGLIHIACNMYSLYIIGPEIQKIYGGAKYLVIYLFSCVTASLLSYLMSPNSLSVGASGGIFGLMGALLIFAIIERHKINKRYILSILQVIVINLFIGLSLANIDNFAHAGGLVGGTLMGYITYKRASEN